MDVSLAFSDAVSSDGGKWSTRPVGHELVLPSLERCLVSIVWWWWDFVQVCCKLFVLLLLLSASADAYSTDTSPVVLDLRGITAPLPCWNQWCNVAPVGNTWHWCFPMMEWKLKGPDVLGQDVRYTSMMFTNIMYNRQDVYHINERERERERLRENERDGERATILVHICRSFFREYMCTPRHP